MVRAILALTAALCAVMRCAALRTAIEPRSWPEASAQAAKVLEKVSYKERREFLHNVKLIEEHTFKYGPDHQILAHKGYTRRIKDLGVTSLKMQDGASGYHNNKDTLGTSTCFPSMLALASTWDPKLAQAYGAAIGKEFRGKGSNMLLGPSLTVHRNTKDGRNVESLSGEDPYLGASLGREYIQAVQSQGVIAAVKNFAYSEANPALGMANVIVSNATAWQLYYPPFEAAVEAGAVAMTCPGIMVNGQHACANARLLNSDLKGKMGFKGFVVSDWGATTAGVFPVNGVKAVLNGLDLETPEAVLSKNALFWADHNERGPAQQGFDAAFLRVIGAIFRLKLDKDEGCFGPHDCKAALQTDVTSKVHSALARDVATEAVTLLKNGGILPLGNSSGVKTLLVVGSAADARQDGASPLEVANDYYSAGGADHCLASSVVTPLAAISHRAAQLGISVKTSTSGEVFEAVNMARSVDLVIVVAATTATSARPRFNLALDGGADELIMAVAEVKKTVVLMQTPGAVLTPWRDNVAAIANLFLAGQETGSAWAAVLFGDAEPSGRLPVMFPATASDVTDSQTPEQAASGNWADYSEGLFTSYRSNSLKAAFPFGHGLSFTTFVYKPPEVVRRCGAKICVSMRVNNTGLRPGREVAQAYLQFPAAANMPRRLLRGFKKTKLLQPGDSQEVLFSFTARDLSTYQQGNWFAWEGVIAHFGASSEDIRHELVLKELPPEAPWEAAPALALERKVVEPAQASTEAPKKPRTETTRKILSPRRSHVKKHH